MVRILHGHWFRYKIALSPVTDKQSRWRSDYVKTQIAHDTNTAGTLHTPSPPPSITHAGWGGKRNTKSKIRGGISAILPRFVFVGGWSSRWHHARNCSNFPTSDTPREWVIQSLPLTESGWVVEYPKAVRWAPVCHCQQCVLYYAFRSWTARRVGVLRGGSPTKSAKTMPVSQCSWVAPSHRFCGISAWNRTSVISGSAVAFSVYARVDLRSSCSCMTDGIFHCELAGISLVAIIVFFPPAEGCNMQNGAAVGLRVRIEYVCDVI